MVTRFYGDICVNTVVMDLPSFKVRGCVTCNEDGSYTIFINSKFSAIQQEKTYLHELGHILGGDFSKFDVNAIELERHTI